MNQIVVKIKTHRNFVVVVAYVPTLPAMTWQIEYSWRDDWNWKLSGNWVFDETSSCESETDTLEINFLLKLPTCNQMSLWMKSNLETDWRFIFNTSHAFEHFTFYFIFFFIDAVQISMYWTWIESEVHDEQLSPLLWWNARTLVENSNILVPSMILTWMHSPNTKVFLHPPQ